MSGSPDRDVVVFTEAIELPAVERAAYLERACGGDKDLRQRVEAMLEVQDRVGNFLEQSPQTASTGTRPGTYPAEKEGDHIGRYKLLQQIGEGGWGVVYMAEQKEPIRRRVALKIIKQGMDTKNVIARFEAERQALALMDHPNIAKVFDAGATESGRPYFVMELVRGVKITDYCDQQSLTTEERLKLFVQVCQTVQHAHQKGIIHRDIKPSNILVTQTLEGAALPVVIDFGIAKATSNQQLTDKTLFTAFDMLIGTPAYMSPEQAALTRFDVDTRTDIYSLGVLLYELLTGSTPFDVGELLRSGLDEVRRVIREQEPARPSTRLSKLTAKDLTEVARNRQSEPPTLIRAVRGDLDWIAMKALEKDRTRRYETANGLALDVQHFLAGETVSARPPSALYKLQKMILRNKYLFCGIGIIAILLVSSLIIISISLARERRARREADTALLQSETDKIKAQTEAAKSRQVTQFLEDMLQGVGPSVARGQDTTMLREVLDQTAKRVGHELTDQPAVEAELRSLMGRLYMELGDYDQAEEMHHAALAIDRKLFGAESREAAASLNDLGLAYSRNGKTLEGTQAFQEALDIRRRLPGNDNPDLADSLNNLGEMYTDRGKVPEGEALVREALGIRQKLFGSNSLETASSLRSLSIILGDEGQWAESEAMARDVLAIRRKELGPEDPLVATSLTDVAWAAGGAGQLDEAESLEREALALRQKILGQENPDVSKSFYQVGDRLREEGKLNEAHSFLSAALSMQLKLLGDDNMWTLDTKRSLGLTFEAEGKWAEAEEMHREALASWRARGDAEIPQGLAELESLTHVLAAEKKYEDAERLLNESLTPAFVKQPASSGLLNIGVDINARLGRWPEAAADAAQAHENQPMDSNHFSELAALLVKTHNRPAYELLRRQLLQAFTNTSDIYAADQVAKASLFLPASQADLLAISNLADLTVTLGAKDEGAMPYFAVSKALSDYRLGHFTEAVEWAQKPLNTKSAGAYGPAYAVLAMSDWELGEKDGARAMLAKGDALVPGNYPARYAEDPGSEWAAWLFARDELDEAEALIQPAATGDMKSGIP